MNRNIALVPLQTRMFMFFDSLELKEGDFCSVRNLHQKALSLNSDIFTRKVFEKLLIIYIDIYEGQRELQAPKIKQAKKKAALELERIYKVLESESNQPQVCVKNINSNLEEISFRDFKKEGLLAPPGSKERARKSKLGKA